MYVCYDGVRFSSCGGYCGWSNHCDCGGRCGPFRDSAGGVSKVSSYSVASQNNIVMTTMLRVRKGRKMVMEANEAYNQVSFQNQPPSAVEFSSPDGPVYETVN